MENQLKCITKNKTNLETAEIEKSTTNAKAVEMVG